MKITVEVELFTEYQSEAERLRQKLIEELIDLDYVSAIHVTAVGPGRLAWVDE